MSIARLKQAYHGLKSWSQRYRWPLTALGALLLVVGVAWSLERLEFDPAQIDIGLVALVALVLIPAGMVVAAINLQLMGRAVGTRITFKTAFAATVYGRIAEVLPIPGAAMVRGAALMQSGAKMGEALTIMVWSSLLSLAMVGLCASVPLIMALPAAGWLLAAGSTLGALISGVWVLRQSGAGLLGSMVAVRFAYIVLGALRFWACFAAIGFPLSLANSALFVVSSTITNFVGIVPGGLGISEFLSAGLALLVDVAPSQAFLAAAINNILTLAMAGVVALILPAAFTPKAAPAR